jgi:hypothetical protein
VSVGVNVTFCDAVPTAGTVVGVVKANVPATATPLFAADPPVSLTEASVPPYVMLLAVGHVIVSVGDVTVTDTVPDTAL